MIIMFYLIKKI